jgi:glycosyltransferase involved in cell wall biosynthesis
VPAQYLLDLSRLVSRLGRAQVLTGIDRVERAYLAHFLGLNVPISGLARTRFGYLLLDQSGCAQVLDMAQGPPTARPAVQILRPLAKARRPHFMAASLLRHLPRKGGAYLNVGHSNLSASLLSALARADWTSAVLIHDTIPLDHPHFARAGTVQPFAQKITATARHADFVIHISRDARAKTEAHFAKAGRVPQGILAPLGVTLAAPVDPPFHVSAPYFVALGTIEPRKNIGFLLDIWAKLGADAPQLVVIGAKGWADAALFAQLSVLQATGRVLHAENLGDGAAMHLLGRATALLFPSLAEGFGLPPIEAAALGTPVVATDLPVLRETCGDFAVYLAASDSYSWMETIQTLARIPKAAQEQSRQRQLPSWADHFKAVLTQVR